jgi:hypothetical protein
MLQWDHPIVLFSSAFFQAPDHPCKYNMHQQIAISHKGSFLSPSFFGSKRRFGQTPQHFSLIKKNNNIKLKEKL